MLPVQFESAGITYEMQSARKQVKVLSAIKHENGGKYGKTCKAGENKKKLKYRGGKVFFSVIIMF